MSEAEVSAIPDGRGPLLQGWARAVRGRRWIPVFPNWFGVALASSYLAVVALLTLLAPVLPIQDPEAGTGTIAGRPLEAGLLGTDQLGRDIFSRVIWGGRASILIAIVATSLAAAAGLFLGLIAGYFRSFVDTGITAAIDVILAFPTLVLLMAVIAVRGPSIPVLILCMVVILVTGFTRLARASTIAFADRAFVRASRGFGASSFRVLRRDLLPNVVPTTYAYSLSAAAHVLLVEGSLSFLGLGVPPPTAAWGSMIQGGRSMFTFAPHIVVAPALVMCLTVASFNTLGDFLSRGRLKNDAIVL